MLHQKCLLYSDALGKVSSLLLRASSISQCVMILNKLLASAVESTNELPKLYECGSMPGKLCRERRGIAQLTPFLQNWVGYRKSGCEYCCTFSYILPSNEGRRSLQRYINNSTAGNQFQEDYPLTYHIDTISYCTTTNNYLNLIG